MERSVKRTLLLLYHLAVLAAIAIAIRGIARGCGEPSCPHHAARAAEHGLISPAQARLLFPKAARVLAADGPHGWAPVLETDNTRPGDMASTAPVANKTIGYAGPTTVLIGLGRNGKIMGARILESADSEDFVHEVVASGMLDRWNGMTPTEAANAAVDTVSGATMTSTAIRNGVALRLKLATSGPAAAHVASGVPVPVWWKEIVTAALIGAAVGLCFWSGRWRNRLRLVLLAAAVGWIGLYAGSFISQALLFGWVQALPPWQRQPSLVLLVAAAVLVPILSGRALYCTYLCPHGAAQDLVGRIGRKPVKIRPSLARWLARLPYAALLTILGLVAWGMPAGELGSFEPFAAYQALNVVVLISVIIAAVSLIASVFVRLPWCRFGCPTGALLRYLQRPGKQARFGLTDLVSGLTALTLLLVWLLCA
jgi:FMN-binding protein/4Fe-4S binding protein